MGHDPEKKPERPPGPMPADVATTANIPVE